MFVIERDRPIPDVDGQDAVTRHMVELVRRSDGLYPVFTTVDSFYKPMLFGSEAEAQSVIDQLRQQGNSVEHLRIVRRSTR